jgi:hypothetical protein
MPLTRGCLTANRLPGNRVHPMGMPMNSPDPITQPDVSQMAPSKSIDDQLPTRRLLTTAISAGILAGILAWGIGEVVSEVFVAPSQTTTMGGRTLRRISFRDRVAADKKNATLAFTALGLVMGLVLGMAGGILRKSALSIVTGGATGLLLGCALTAGASWGVLPFYFRALARSEEALSHELMLPLLVHAGIWAAAGLAGGVGLAIGLGVSWSRLFNAALGGLVGGALGAVAYEFLGALLLPADRTSEPLATTWQARLLARLLVAVLAAALAAVSISTGKRSATAGQITT